MGATSLPKAKEMAESISKNGPTAITLAMEVMQRGMDMSLDNGLAFESAMAAMCIGTPEAAQRLKTFLERKR
jgi:enoyl-CoA hydratase